MSGTNQANTPQFRPGKRAYRDETTRHALIVHYQHDTLPVIVGDVNARGAAVYDTGPISLLNEAAARALRDDLDAWLTRLTLLRARQAAAS